MGGGRFILTMFIYINTALKKKIKKKFKKKNFNFPILLIYRSLGNI